MPQEDGLIRESFASAEEFLGALSPMDVRWKFDPTAWIYRGQANADWKLRAKAIRSRDAFSAYRIPGDPLEWSSRKRMMLTLLDNFQKRLDTVGIAAPTVPPAVIPPGVVTIPDGEPTRNTFPLMALAQHHGLPTLLLDWSRRSRVAAYFAAVEAANKETHGLGKHMAVWALRFAYPNDGHDPLGRRLAIYDAPAATNPNLRAQSGVFTLLRDGPTESDSADGAMPLEQFVEQATRPAPEVLIGVLLLRQLSLTIVEAPSLLRLLSYEGIDGASMFPGADGVVRAMRERALWDK